MHTRVIDFPVHELDTIDDSEPEPAGIEDFNQLRTHAAFISNTINSIYSRAEHIVHIGHNFHLHLLDGANAFGVYSKNPQELEPKAAQMALRAPLATRNMYLRVPGQERHDITPYVAGNPNMHVSRRSIQRIISLCIDFIDQRTQNEQSEQQATRTDIPA